MSKRVVEPDGTEWRARRALLRGKDGHGRRLRWRGPDVAFLELIQLGEFAGLSEIPIIGVVAVGISVLAFVVVALLFLPALALGLLQALVLGALFVVAVVAATVFGRPILVRAEQRASGASTVWAVTGWGPSRKVRDQVVNAIGAGLDPATAVSDDVTLVAHRPG